MEPTVTQPTTRRPSVTRADVARLAGVSTAVVSYVVNDGPRPVAAATAARVREAMELLLPSQRQRARPGERHQPHPRPVLADSLNPYFAEYTWRAGPGGAAQRRSRADRRLPRGRGRRAGARRGARRPAGRRAAVRQHVRRFDRRRWPASAGIPTVLIDCPGPVPGRRDRGPTPAGQGRGSWWSTWPSPRTPADRADRRRRRLRQPRPARTGLVASCARGAGRGP